MSKVVAELKYSAEQEWGCRDGASPVGTVSRAWLPMPLGDIVSVDLPEVGCGVTAGESCGEIESASPFRTCTPL